MYARIYGTVSERQLRILRAALDYLERDPEHPFTWIRLPFEITRTYGDLDDWEPILEPARTLEGTRVAVFLRELGNGKVKLSLRSNGDLDVAKVAHALGGGGHEKAAGAELDGTLEEAAARVREALARGMRESVAS
jgi:phosphoesterase RecJ-like protein